MTFHPSQIPNRGGIYGDRLEAGRDLPGILGSFDHHRIGHLEHAVVFRLQHLPEPGSGDVDAERIHAELAAQTTCVVNRQRPSSIQFHKTNGTNKRSPDAQ